MDLEKTDLGGLNSYLLTKCGCVHAFLFFCVVVLLVMKTGSLAYTPLSWSSTSFLFAVRAGDSRGNLDGRIGLMKLSEACSIMADGRACQTANREAVSVISRA